MSEPSDWKRAHPSWEKDATGWAARGGRRRGDGLVLAGIVAGSAVVTGAVAVALGWLVEAVQGLL